MSKHTKIERATTSDLLVLTALLEMQFIEHRIEVDPSQLESAVGRLVADENLGVVLVARVASAPVGCAVISFAWTLEHGGKSAWLDELYVLPEHRNSGIGSLLLQGALDEAGAAGCLAVDLEVEGGHRRVETLYRRAGFQRLERSRWVKRVKPQAGVP